MLNDKERVDSVQSDNLPIKHRNEKAVRREPPNPTMHPGKCLLDTVGNAFMHSETAEHPHKYGQSKPCPYGRFPTVIRQNRSESIKWKKHKKYSFFPIYKKSALCYN